MNIVNTINDFLVIQGVVEDIITDIDAYHRVARIEVAGEALLVTATDGLDVSKYFVPIKDVEARIDNSN